MASSSSYTIVKSKPLLGQHPIALSPLDCAFVEQLSEVAATLTINNGTHGVVDEAAPLAPTGDPIEELNRWHRQSHVDSLS